jgi:hypothetical protein
MSEIKKPFESIFPYFSFRWRYIDGEYSPYAPFNKVTFTPEEPDIEDFFKQGHNTSMTNSVEKILLQGIDRGGPDVVAVDLLYTESISSTVYILKTIEIPENERGNGQGISLKIDKRSFSSALPNNELSRAFDNVPLLAKAQEITANRLMYGNYLSKYDHTIIKNGVATPLDFAIELDTITISSADNGPAIKSDRTYEVGVSYIDKYGRIGGLLTQKGSNVAKEGSAFKTDFSYEYRPTLIAKIKSEAPEWAKFYRYYVKDVSGEHFNLSGFNIYNDGTSADTESDNVYVQFNSTDRNKISDDTVLIPRRHTFGTRRVGTSYENIFTSQSRHQVLDIENEAPDVVKNQVNARTSTKIFTWTDNIRDNAASIRIVPSGSGSNSASNSALTNGQTVIYIKDGSGNDWDEQGLLNPFNQYIASQGGTEKLGVKNNTPVTQNTTVDMSAYESNLVVEFVNSAGTSKRTIVNEVQMVGRANQRNTVKLTLGFQLDDDNQITSTTGVGGIPSADFDLDFETITAKNPEEIKFYKYGLSDEGKERLQGSFWVKIPRKTADAVITQIPTGQTDYDEEGKVSLIREINFETEPINDSNIDLYWEAAKTLSVEDSHGKTNSVDWANCITTIEPITKKVYLESTRILDKFNSVSLAKGIRVNTPDARYAQERRKSGLIFSDLYNSKTGINGLNSFNLSIGITKELEPNYGGIQKLHTLDTNLLAFTEDKIFRILADKDALFNADDGVNVVATNLVLGQTQPIRGAFGISTHPESFATFGENIYFSDAKRGTVMQLTPSNGQLFPISSLGMSNFFKDRLNTVSKVIGSHDGSKNAYVISLQGYNPSDLAIGTEAIVGEDGNLTLGYSPRSKGWTSRYSFIPESGITLYNKYYTFKNGNAYLHNSETGLRNNFYGTQYNSEVQVIFNDGPGFVKDWLSLNYEGSVGWTAEEIIADQDSDIISDVRILDNIWFEKEGRYYGAIAGTEPVYIIDPSGVADNNGFFPLIQDGNNTRTTAGTKGFFEKVKFRNTSTAVRELFAISTEYYISQS